MSSAIYFISDLETHFNTKINIRDFYYGNDLLKIKYKPAKFYGDKIFVHKDKDVVSQLNKIFDINIGNKTYFIEKLDIKHGKYIYFKFYVVDKKLSLKKIQRLIKLNDYKAFE